MCITSSVGVSWSWQHQLGLQASQKQKSINLSVQKTACAIILGKKFQSYKSALKILNMETLEIRREYISLDFARKALKSEKFKQWFAMEERTEPNIRTRGYRQKPELKPVTSKRMRYKNSPIPYLTELLNSQK